MENSVSAWSTKQEPSQKSLKLSIQPCDMLYPLEVTRMDAVVEICLGEMQSQPVSVAEIVSKGPNFGWIVILWKWSPKWRSLSEPNDS